MKRFSMLPLVSLTVLMLAACGQQGTSTNSGAPNTPAASQTAAGAFSQEDAKALAFKTAGIKEAEATNLQVRTETENGRTVYEIEFDHQGTEYSYTISAQDGSLLEQSSEAADQVVTSQVAIEEAKAIALKDAGKTATTVSNLTATQDQENGQLVYEVEFEADQQEYSYTIDATRGTIISRETESAMD